MRAEDAVRHLPPELAFLARHGVSCAALHEAAELGRRWQVQPVEALLAAGLARADTVYRALAGEIGLPFLEPGFVAHRLARFPEAVTSGIAPLAGAGPGGPYAYAPRGSAFAAALAGRARRAPGLLVTTPAALRDAVFAACGETIARRAAEDLARRSPEDSFHGGMTVGQLVAGYGVALLAGMLLVLASGSFWTAANLLLAAPFLGLAAIKLASVTEPGRPAPPIRGWPQPDRVLPHYTVLVPLYRERRVVPGLIAALTRLDYPVAKLDVKLLVEADDQETAAALAAIAVPPHIEIVTAPPGRPRTKPRALNIGLALARGRYVVVYDAEDVPEPGQLRDAAAEFERQPPDVACLQARLVVDNTGDGLLTGFFTVEYGGLFDVVNPALARFDLPVPLGGTSNHLKVDVLRRLGGWDPWNVTEDADLAIRLATAGLRVADLPSSTLEEAPSRLRPWLAQRTRWMKGFLQVTITHSRRPVRNLGRLGPARLFGAAVLIFGAVASALAYPIFTVLVIGRLATGTLFDSPDPGDILGDAVAATLLVAGTLAMILPGFAAIARRRWWGLWPFALAMPLYYLLVSLGAWRGLFELLTDPDRWNKTEHGLARTSRTGQLPIRD